MNNSLIDNAYFKIGDHVFKQIIGIAMGSDPAPFQANLGLHYYEFAFLNKYANRKVARKLNHTQRYIDDINTKNDGSEFSSNMKTIYPQELELSKENKGTTLAGTVLEIDISIHSKKFVTKVYDKRDDFNFEIIKYPSTSSNIHDSTLHAVFISQLIRYARVCNNIEYFIDRCQRLYHEIKKKGATLKSLRGVLNKFCRKNTK